jgi:hypothetical protein
LAALAPPTALAADLAAQAAKLNADVPHGMVLIPALAGQGESYLVPLLPFCVLPVALRIDGTILLSITALFVLGLATSLFNARSPWFSGFRQVVIGAAAAGVTYLVGQVFGALAGAR